MRVKLTLLVGAAALLATVAVGCGSKKSAAPKTSTSACSVDQLNLVHQG